MRFGTKLGLIALVSALALWSIAPVFAVTTSTLNTTVSTPIVSVTVSPPTVDYGTANWGATTAASSLVTVTNNGTVSEKFQISGGDATCEVIEETGTYTNSWSLVASATPGAEQYAHEWSKTGAGSWSFLQKDPTWGELANPVSIGGTQSLYLRLTTPSTPSVLMGQYTAPVYVRAIGL